MPCRGRMVSVGFVLVQCEFVGNRVRFSFTVGDYLGCPSCAVGYYLDVPFVLKKRGGVCAAVLVFF
jgi:hypothetical protein